MTIAPENPELKWVPCPDFLPCKFTVLHSKTNENNMDICLKFPAKANIPFHTHTSAEHMIMMKVLKKGDYACGPANLPHDGYCTSEYECIMFIAYETPQDAVLYNHSHKRWLCVTVYEALQRQRQVVASHGQLTTTRKILSIN